MSEIEYAYEGLVVSSIKVREKLGKDGKKVGNQVLFNDIDETGEDAIFLKCVIDLGRGKFEATKLETEEAKDLITKPHQRVGESDEDYAKRFEARQSATPLFCVHGYNTKPERMFKDAKDAASIFDKKGGQHYPVPVLWATRNNPLFYWDDQQNNSKEAGEKLRDFVEKIDDDTFPRKSLMMHSMGNHVIFNGACAGEDAPEVQFENIFFVAADLPHDIFHKNPWEDYNDRQKEIYGEKYKKATNFLKMLARKPDDQPKGKIYFLHHLNDSALAFSGNPLNREKRLGQRGIGMAKHRWTPTWYEDKNLVRDDIRNYYQNYDATGKPMSSLDLTIKKHNYHFEDWAIKFYNEESEKISQS